MGVGVGGGDFDLIEAIAFGGRTAEDFAELVGGSGRGEEVCFCGALPHLGVRA